MNDNKVAATILLQIGRRALYMIGALKNKSMIALENGVIFKIDRNSRRINKIKITLNSMDTYDIQYWYNAISKKTWEDKSKLIAEDKGVYFDQLRESIERNIGLYTSL